MEAGALTAQLLHEAAYASDHRASSAARPASVMLKAPLDSSCSLINPSTFIAANTCVAVRDVEIGVVNRYTQAERTVRFQEEWRWDPESKNWWLVNGLPNLWDGQ